MAINSTSHDIIQKAQNALCAALLIVGMCGLLYLGWAYYRISPIAVVHDSSWPRPSPYPDQWLLRLHDWYDARHPAPPGFFKIHGELDRVRIVLALWLGIFAILTIAGAARWFIAPLGERIGPSCGQLFQSVARLPSWIGLPLLGMIAPGVYMLLAFLALPTFSLLCVATLIGTCAALIAVDSITLTEFGGMLSLWGRALLILYLASGAAGSISLVLNRFNKSPPRSGTEAG